MFHFFCDNSCFLSFVLGPGKVLALSVSNSVSIPSRQVEVSWIKPEGGNDVNFYFIQCYQIVPYNLVGSDFVQHKLKNTHYNFTFPNLQSGTKYKVVVRAKNAGDYGLEQLAYITTGSYYFFNILVVFTSLKKIFVNIDLDKAL